MPESSSSTIWQYSIATASDSLNDLNLHIVPLTNQQSHDRNRTSASVQRPQRQTAARWIRRRILTNHDEIVDQLFDVQRGRICWTSHRPTQGWYLHLRSPTLPPNIALPLRPPPSALREQANGTTPLVLSIKSRVRVAQAEQLAARMGPVDASSSTSATSSDDSTQHKEFVSVNLHHDQVEEGKEQSMPAQIDTSSETAVMRNTSVEGESIAGQKGHTRRRSAGGSKSAISHGARRSVSNPSSTPVVPEEASSSDPDGTVTRQDGLVGPSADERANHPHSEIDAQPRLCTLLLSESLGPEAKTEENTSWAHWAWNAIPSFVRPAFTLSLDRSKSFSIWWIDALTTAGQPRKVEVVRFEDQTSFWSFQGRTVGRILLHREAVEALNLDCGLWIASTLAYLEFLEERDGYNASLDG